MKWISRVLVITLLSVAAAALLSYMSRLDGAVSVFRTVSAKPVTEENIVDVVSSMGLHLRVRRVEVSHAIISIDLLAAKSTDPGDMLRDMYQIPQVIFAGSNNINQVLIRVLDASQEKEGSHGPLIAADARRERWLPHEPKLSSRSTDEIKQYLEAHYRMTYTTKWQERSRTKS